MSVCYKPKFDKVVIVNGGKHHSNGNMYGIEGAVYAEVFRLADKNVDAKTIYKHLYMLNVLCPKSRMNEIYEAKSIMHDIGSNDADDNHGIVSALLVQ